MSNPLPLHLAEMPHCLPHNTPEAHEPAEVWRAWHQMRADAYANIAQHDPVNATGATCLAQVEQLKADFFKSRAKDQLAEQFDIFEGATSMTDEHVCPQVLSVDRDDFEGVELPAAFTCRTLDTDDAQAAAARRELGRAEDSLADLHCALELFERGLEAAEPYSHRARQACAALRETLSALEPAFSGMDRARRAFLVRWPDPPRATSC